MKFLTFVKNHKILVIFLLFFITLFITAFLLLRTFFPSGNEYGNRLKGIEKVAISKKEEDGWVTKLKDKKNIKDVSVHIKGRLINIILTVDEEASVGDMKDHVKDNMEIFDEDELGYYDIQFYINSEKENEKFPVIGYRHKGQDKLVWSNN